MVDLVGLAGPIIQMHDEMICKDVAKDEGIEGGNYKRIKLAFPE